MFVGVGRKDHDARLAWGDVEVHIYRPSGDEQKIRIEAINRSDDVGVRCVDVEVVGERLLEN